MFRDSVVYLFTHLNYTDTKHLIKSNKFKFLRCHIYFIWYFFRSWPDLPIKTSAIYLPFNKSWNVNILKWLYIRTVDVSKTKESHVQFHIKSLLTRSYLPRGYYTFTPNMIFCVSILKKNTFNFYSDNVNIWWTNLSIYLKNNISLWVYHSK